MSDRHEIAPHSLYGYTPTEWVCALYVVLFSITTLLHAAQAMRKRLWWLFPTIVTCGLTEIIGWSARLWSSQSPYQIKPFLMQIVTTITAPSFLTAASFIMLGIIIQRLGEHHSRLSPRNYSLVFITADVVALVVQAAGGAIASRAAETGVGDPEIGAKIMCGGIIWQLAAITVYVILAAEFFIRLHLDKPVRRTVLPDRTVGEEKVGVDLLSRGKSGFARGSGVSLMIIGLVLSTVMIYIRSIYRTIELLDGWSGTIITTELYFNVLDAMPITVAMFTINFLHPGWLLFGENAKLASRTSITSVL